MSKLKPPCVALSDAALTFQTGNVSNKQLISRLEDLDRTLKSIQNSSSKDHLTAKLSEYVFFPLSHIFRQRQSIPNRALELALQCLLVLLKTGWSHALPSELGVQLMILLTFVAGNSEGKVDFKTTAEDLLAINFACLTLVVQSLVGSPAGRDILTSLDHIPALGHAITISLDGLSQTYARNVAEEALAAVHSFINGLSREVVASFLPGILSTLTKVLTPSASRKRPFQILVRCLDAVGHLLQKVFDNDFKFGSSDNDRSATSKMSVPQLDHKWLTATSSQAKMAMANIAKIRKHDRSEVRKALQDLCMLILQKCNHNLEDMEQLLLNTLLSLASSNSIREVQLCLQILLSENAVYAEHLKSSLYDCFLSLPRKMMSGDAMAKQSAANEIACSIQVLLEAGSEFDFAQIPILSSVRDGVLGIIQHSSYTIHTESVPSSILIPMPSQSSVQESGAMDGSFPKILAAGKPNSDNMETITAIVKALASTDGSLNMVRDCLDQLVRSNAQELVVNLWLANAILQERATSSADVTDFLDLDQSAPHESRLREELFQWSVSTINHVEEDMPRKDFNWQVQALCLEVITFQASHLKFAFRPELSDTLFPVLQLLGSSDHRLRSHAMIALNSIARSTGYSSPQALVIDNNDYLINGIGLKLNTFDISPQAPQVLNMLVRLCGSKLLPFLDDLTDSIFEALEYFHGYDSLVGLLFQCLGSMVEEGVTSPPLTIQGTDKQIHRSSTRSPTKMSDVVQTIKLWEPGAEQDGLSNNGDIQDLPATTPQQPWKGLQSGSDDQTRQGAESSVSDSEEKPSPLSQSYHLVHRITVLTQHHIPSGNPLIRSHLLHILSIALPYLARHEDTFLPLINTLWPVLVPRLRDSEASVVAGALDSIARMAEGAGGFVRGRIADAWPEIRGVHRQVLSMFQKQLRSNQWQSQTLRSQPWESHEPQSDREPKLLIELDRNSHLEEHIRDTNTKNAEDHRLKKISSRTLADTKSSPQASSSGADSFNSAYMKGQYIPNTGLTIWQALTRFLILLVKHVEVPAWMFDEILNDMLLPYLSPSATGFPWIDKCARDEIKEALGDHNADAVWLKLLRTGQLHDEQGLLKSIRPTNIDGAPGFIYFGDLS